MELSELGKRLFLHGLRRRFPDADEKQIVGGIHQADGAMSQSELLKKVTIALEATGTPYMLTGSYASSLQGEPRLTHDIDLVVAITLAAARSLL